jgi:hypothetical protein
VHDLLGEIRLGEVHPVEQWREAKAVMSRAEFEERYPQLFLVWMPGTPMETTPGGNGRVEFHTFAAPSPAAGHLPNASALRTQPVSAPSSSGTLPPPAEPVVIPLMKEPANPFPDRISIGRAPNCDLVIREASVSKLHGHFREVTLESAVYIDLRSANGSRLNGATITPGEAVSMKALDELVLGLVRLKMMSVADLYRWL